jgi:hypothetical protein
MIQQLQGELQKAQQFIQTKQAEQQGSLQETQIKAQTDLQIAKHKADTDADRELALQMMKNATSIAVARISASKSQLDPVAEAAEERLATGLQHAHEVGMQGMKQQHEKDLAAQAHQQALEQGSQGAVIDQQAQESDQAHQAEMAQQAAEQAKQQPNGGGGA